MRRPDSSVCDEVVRNDESALSSLSPEKLYAQFRHGHEGSFRELFKRYHKRLVAHLRKYVGNHHQAEDIAQNTWIQIRTRVTLFQVGKKFQPWFFTIATNQAIDFQRRNKHHNTALSLSSDDFLLQDSHKDVTLAEALADDGCAVLESCEERELQGLLQKLLEKMTPNHRQVLVLIHLQSLMYREVADMLGIRIGTVKSRLHAAQVKLREAIEELELVDTLKAYL